MLAHVSMAKKGVRQFEVPGFTGPNPPNANLYVAKHLVEPRAVGFVSTSERWLLINPANG